MIRKKDLRGQEIKSQGGTEMDILITMAYTAIMTAVVVKVIERTPKDHK